MFIYLFRKISAAKNPEVASLEPQTPLRWVTKPFSPKLMAKSRSEWILKKDSTSVAPPQWTQTTTATHLTPLITSTCHWIENRMAELTKESNTNSSTTYNDNNKYWKDGKGDQKDNEDMDMENNNDEENVDSNSEEESSHDDDDNEETDGSNKEDTSDDEEEALNGREECTNDYDLL